MASAILSFILLGYRLSYPLRLWFVYVRLMRLLTVYFYLLAFEVTLNPDPKQSAIGHRPVGMPLAVLCTVSGLSDDSRPGMLWTKAHSDISKCTMFCKTFNVGI